MTSKPEEKKYVEISNTDGLWAEKAEARTYDINTRSLCLKHDFTNASLHWGKIVSEDREGKIAEWHMALAGEKWGGGYGGIRFCKRCRHIDCIHSWEDTWTFRLYHHKYFYTEYHVSRCKICQTNILISGCGCYQGTKEASDLIGQIAKEFGYLYRGDPTRDRFGSYFYTHLPAETARRMDESMPDAEQYVREVFRKGEIA